MRDRGPGVDDVRVTTARILTFHVNTDELAEVTKALDDVAGHFAENPDFRGLVCLEHASTRHEVIVLTLWDGEGLESSHVVSEAARERIAATTDLGVTSRSYEVLRLIPGAASLERAVAQILSS